MNRFDFQKLTDIGIQESEGLSTLATGRSDDDFPERTDRLDFSDMASPFSSKGRWGRSHKSHSSEENQRAE